jgi:hypothetical protein
MHGVSIEACSPFAGHLHSSSPRGRLGVRPGRDPAVPASVFSPAVAIMSGQSVRSASRCPGAWPPTASWSRMIWCWVSSGWIFLLSNGPPARPGVRQPPPACANSPIVRPQLRGCKCGSQPPALAKVGLLHGRPQRRNLESPGCFASDAGPPRERTQRYLDTGRVCFIRAWEYPL